jgi:formate hydrogenlyase subunit 3/multisubunit Na+/H+ antiporter MnhD subunit
VPVPGSVGWWKAFMTTINGLPAHVLLVHLVVVLIPLSAVLLVLVAVWPSARRRLDVLTAVLAVLALIAVPITTEAGDWLEHRLPRTPLLRVHTHLGDTMLPWAIALALVAVLVLVRSRRLARRASAGGEPANVEIREPHQHQRPGRREQLTGIAVAVVAVAVAVGSMVTVYRIGDSGAQAAWTGQFSAQPLPQTKVPAAPNR